MSASVAKWAVCALACALTSLPAQAQPTIQGNANDQSLAQPDRALVYESPQTPSYWRMLALQLAVLGGGLTLYYKDRDLNSQDWEYSYNWPALKAKLTGEAYSLDNNYFDTNVMAHSAAGALYYAGARSIRLTILESLLVAFSTSAVWEFLAEFREEVSINDLIVTPLSGLAIAETSIQLGTFFDRSCSTRANQVLGTVLMPFKTVNDQIDGAQPWRATYCDANGLTKRGEHRFEFGGGGALTFELQGPRSAPQGSARVRIQAEVINLRNYGRAGHAWTTFADGNVTLLDAELTGASTGVSDLRLLARPILAGAHHRNLRRSSDQKLTGTEFILGGGFGIEYSRHRYGQQAPKNDPVFVLEVPSLFGRWRWLRQNDQVEAGLIAAGTFSEVGVFAMEEYSALNSRDELATVASLHGYNHALGFALSPHVTWRKESLQLGIEARADRFFALPSFAGGTSGNSVKTTEMRQRARLWLRVKTPLGFSWQAEAAALNRRGTVGSVRARRAELQLGTSVQAEL